MLPFSNPTISKYICWLMLLGFGLFVNFVIMHHYWRFWSHFLWELLSRHHEKKGGKWFVSIDCFVMYHITLKIILLNICIIHQIIYFLNDMISYSIIFSVVNFLLLFSWLVVSLNLHFLSFKITQCVQVLIL